MLSYGYCHPSVEAGWMSEILGVWHSAVLTQLKKVAAVARCYTQ